MAGQLYGLRPRLRRFKERGPLDSGQSEIVTYVLGMFCYPCIWAGQRKDWGERWDLNPRPSVPQTDALPTELRSPPSKCQAKTAGVSHKSPTGKPARKSSITEGRTQTDAVVAARRRELVLYSRQSRSRARRQAAAMVTQTWPVPHQLLRFRLWKICIVKPNA